MIFTATYSYQPNYDFMSNSQPLLPRQRAVLDIPLNRHLGIVFDGSVDGVAKSHFQSTPELATFDGQLHGGALSVLFEVAAFLALLISNSRCLPMLKI